MHRKRNIKAESDRESDRGRDRERERSIYVLREMPK